MSINGPKVPLKKHWRLGLGKHTPNGNVNKMEVERDWRHLIGKSTHTFRFQAHSG